MSEGEPATKGRLREEILKDPAAVLEDRDVLRALISADEAARGANVVDLRTIALERLEARLERLEQTHREVLAAAYDNLAATNHIHRAVLALLDPVSFGEFLALLEADLAGILRVESCRLVLESAATSPEMTHQFLSEFGGGVGFCGPGDVMRYITRGRATTARPVTLRAVRDPDPLLFGAAAPRIRSEALLKLDLGPGNLGGMLVLGSHAVDQFTPQKGADLLVFFASVFERVLRRWLQ